MCLYRAITATGLSLILVSSACSRTDHAATPAAATPQIETRELEYRQGETVLKGFVAWDASKTQKVPGVIVVHEWWGHNEHARNQARRLAEAGYVGFALDMYGDGKVTVHPDSAQAFVAEATKDPAVMMARFTAAVEQLKQDPHVDPERIGAIGYCFGGAVVLAAARAGMDVDAVGSFHGALIPGPVDSGAVKARVLVQTGAADPMVPPDAVENFRKEMTGAGANFEIVSYPGVKHSFTNPNADHVGMDGLGYDADADRESWSKLLRMFSEVWS